MPGLFGTPSATSHLESKLNNLDITWTGQPSAAAVAAANDGTNTAFTVRRGRPQYGIVFVLACAWGS